MPASTSKGKLNLGQLKGPYPYPRLYTGPHKGGPFTVGEGGCSSCLDALVYGECRGQEEGCCKTDSGLFSTRHSPLRGREETTWQSPKQTTKKEKPFKKITHAKMVIRLCGHERHPCEGTTMTWWDFSKPPMRFTGNWLLREYAPNQPTNQPTK